MTTPTAAPDVASPRTSDHRFSPVSRARGYHRVGGALIAAGTHDGAPARLTLGLERVVVASVTHRASQAPFEVTGAGPETAAVLTAIAAHADLRGRAEVTVRAPWPRDSGSDVATAAALAAANALVEAADVAVTRSLRAAMVGALGGSCPLPGEDGFGLFDASTGTWVRQFEDAPRFSVQLWHIPGSVTVDLDRVGTLPDGDIPSGQVEAGAWLSAANGVPSGVLGEVFSDLFANDPDVFGVVGGHTDADPVALLLSPDTGAAGEAAYRIRADVAARVEDLHGFVPTFVVQSRTS